jgi:hypothetical protein
VSHDGDGEAHRQGGDQAVPGRAVGDRTHDDDHVVGPGRGRGRRKAWHGRGRRRAGGARPGGVAVVVALVAAAVGAVAFSAAGRDTAVAQSGCGARFDSGGNLIRVREGCPGTGTTTTRQGPPYGSPSGGGEPPPCPRWQLMGTSSDEDVDGDGQIDYPVAAHLRPSDWDAAPVGSSFYYDTCTSPGGFGPGATTMWVPPGGAVPAPPSPDEVAEGLWVDVQEELLRPTVETTPDQDVAATIHVPTFVLVTNWQGEISRSRCVLSVCVSLTATPSLRFDPGEPGAATVVCDPPGTRFDRSASAPSPDAQARDACAHTYQQYTGGRGRPDAWPGEVSVHWDVQWSAAASGASGEFETTLSTALPRAVDEVPTVVADVD